MVFFQDLKSYREILNESVGHLIRIRFFVGTMEGIPAMPALQEIIGKIVKIHDATIYFEHIKIDAVRLQTKKSIFFLNHVVIWSIDYLDENYSEERYMTCSKCGEKLKLSFAQE